jgi:integrase/recombinase XerD
MLTTTNQNNLTELDQTAGILADWSAWLTSLVDAGEMSQATANTYQRGAYKFVAWARAAGLSPADPGTLRAWKADHLKAGHKSSSINAWLSGVKSLYSWAVETNHLPYNPAANVKGAKRKGTGRRHEREPLTDLEIRRVLDQPTRTTAAGRRDLAILSLMAFTALRTVEIHRAELADLRTNGGRLVLYIQGKGHTETDDFVILANPHTQNAVYDWLAARGDQPGPLFTSLSDRSSGGRLSLRSLREMVKQYYRAAGVRGNKTAHSLRHSAITKVLRKSGDLLKAQALARHASAATTGIYLHEINRFDNPAEDYVSYDD